MPIPRRLLTKALLSVAALVVMPSSAPARAAAGPTRQKAAALPSGSIVVFETVLGEFRIRLRPADAPATSANFEKLVRSGFYDGQSFHRIVKDFVVQAGDPSSANDNPFDDGAGGPGYTLEAEIRALHKRGSVAMARQPDGANPERRSNGSQFYVCLRDLPQLDAAGHTVFGDVVSGWETIEALVALSDLPDVARRNRDVNPCALARIVSARMAPAPKNVGSTSRRVVR